MSIGHDQYIFIFIYVVMSWDVLSAGVSTADWQLGAHINVVMSTDHFKSISVVMSRDVLSVEIFGCSSTELSFKKNVFQAMV